MTTYPRIRRHVWDRRRLPAIPQSSPPAVVTVLSVHFLGDATLRWVFSSSITAVGSNCDQLMASNGIDPAESPFIVSASGGNAIIASYEDSLYDDMATYQITEAPEGLTFADGALILPQGGMISP